ncbi:hypothetical protein IV498_17505 [Paenarthrobacter sp. Z7-10]|uniref:hypothetical protein n=1 Tax=Paenarthrobacter sp. Z7-10 TaxID=2787635 RepID=UPI0022A9B02A|nr:hypothetical protein [Paenarthrobacter sp. Z7-10]MCZ2404913.1 hypothetical protein [Paenarthrobacter sp. Z7-10]
MSAPDMSHPDLFTEYTPLNPSASQAETLLDGKTSRTAAPGAGMVDLVFKDPLEGFTW